MPTLPDRKLDTLNFFSDRINDWNDNAAGIGLTPERVATFLTTRINPAAEALEAARQAREAAKAATIAADEALAQLTSDGRALIATVQAFAKETARTGGSADTVYSLARLPPPKPRTPVGAPPLPEPTAAVPQRDGSVTITWRGSMPGRGLYEVQRMLTPVDSSPEAWAFVGNAVEREFTDSSVPAGTLSVSYRVRGVNTAGPGPWSNDIGASLAHRPSTPQFTLRSTVGREAA